MYRYFRFVFCRGDDGAQVVCPYFRFVCRDDEEIGFVYPYLLFNFNQFYTANFLITNILKNPQRDSNGFFLHLANKSFARRLSCVLVFKGLNENLTVEV